MRIGTVYVYGLNLIASIKRVSQEYDVPEEIISFFIQNAHGDIVQLLDPDDNTVSKSYIYDAFGNELDPLTTDTNYLRYCGEYYDYERGEYYLRARNYDPRTGRFTQQDGWGYMNPGDPLSLNLYVYCFGNPITYIDFTGNWPTWAQIGQAAAIAAFATLFVLTVVASAGAVGVMAGAVSASIGASSAIVGAATTAGVIGTYVVAGGIAATAASDIGETFTGHNVIRDDLMGGNQEAYNILKTGLYIIGSGLSYIGASSNSNTTQKISITKEKLQHEYKHAKDYGVVGNWNKDNSELYLKAIENNIYNSTNIFLSTYRGQEVYVYYNANTGIGANEFRDV